jgi:hypothetical protein
MDKTAKTIYSLSVSRSLIPFLKNNRTQYTAIMEKAMADAPVVGMSVTDKQPARRDDIATTGRAYFIFDVCLIAFQ